ncbi:MAG: hypothetical protein L6R41_003081 [Letrouitia leprolyta]|nr:MAG: hypothetical protein L6R41_003081 [Letrouitia leprolyta]
MSVRLTSVAIIYELPSVGGTEEFVGENHPVPNHQSSISISEGPSDAGESSLSMNTTNGGSIFSAFRASRAGRMQEVIAYPHIVEIERNDGVKALRRSLYRSPAQQLQHQGVENAAIARHIESVRQPPEDLGTLTSLGEEELVGGVAGVSKHPPNENTTTPMYGSIQEMHISLRHRWA